ncbi:MAG TPA: DUF2723 domain-containing protein, partial [Verrucomicrobiota bacterium]|nr:DUF2723 domain-containing protein [Verrucomicrobiota bacterium]
RKVDWLAMAITFVFVYVGYLLTLAPEMTLEDSGELAVASFYAGVPHPPGYPVWTLFTYLWTLIPVGNVAWRVGLSCAFAGALSSGLLALVVSRGSSMILESIDDLKNIGRRIENPICLVSGFVAGLLIGFNGYLWSQSVIVEVYPLSVASLMGVVVFLLRWIYAPHQHRYLYLAFFSYGICFNNHQSLLVIAMGVEVLIWLAEPKLGRELFFWNTLLYFAGAALASDMMGSPGVKFVFHVIGISSAIMWVWLCVRTKKTKDEFLRDAAMIGALAFIGLYFANITNYTAGLAELAKQKRGLRLFLDAATSPKFTLVAAVALSALLVTLIRKTRRLSREWAVALGCGFSWLAGAAFYLYMPIAGATNPPMQWGYPRTLEGFIHAVTRGQYEKIRPTWGENLFQFIERYSMQLWRFLEGLNEEFNLIFLLIALVVFLYYRKMKRRERVWIMGMVALFICLGPFLVYLLNFSSDRQSLELNRVFLTSSHLFVAMSAGFGLTLIAASLVVHFNSLRNVALMGGVCVADLALFILAVNSQPEFDAELAAKFGFIKILCWLAAITAVVILWRKGLEHDRLLAFGLPGLFVFASGIITLVTFMGDPPRLSGIGNVFAFIGRAFSPDQYGLPVFAALILLAASLVFLAAAWLSRSRAPIGITLAVFAIMPSYSIMTHWFSNEQRDHYFGYWFGHDMFTPPFPGPDGKLTYDPELREKALSGPDAKLIYPEMTRDAILFGGTDPGRFAPTYMIFCDSFVPPECLPAADPHFDRRDVYIITQNALADGTYLNYIRAHYNRSEQYQYDTPFFQQALRGPVERRVDLRTNLLARLAGRLLDGPIQRRGARLEKKWREQGVYPAKEIYIPTPEDLERCFAEYSQDAAIRRRQGRLRPGEIVTELPNGRVQVSGQVAVMAINGLLTKVIFDHNPDHEFFVEESFPLDWMYPHLTPFGIIMKINRQPLPELSEEILERDHFFWEKYSERLIGNWITYDTTVQEIAEFARRVYKRHDFTGFTGDRKFVRDDQAQKAFSKLRSAIGGVYAWRLGIPGYQSNPQYMPKTEAVRQRLIREADFAFKQAFAFCPYSPEAVFRYVQLLVYLNRIDDALLVAETWKELDPYNQQPQELIDQLSPGKRADAVSQIQQ